MIINNIETGYLEEVELLALWCKTNNLDLNVNETKERVVDFRREKQRSNYTPLNIFWTLVEKVSNYRYLRVHFSENLTWITYITSLVKKARQRL